MRMCSVDAFAHAEIEELAMVCAGLRYRSGARIMNHAWSFRNIKRATFSTNTPDVHPCQLLVFKLHVLGK